jgi:protein ImuB
VRVTVLLTATLSADQGNLLDTSWRDPGAADAALERVRAELGPDAVVTPRARDGYTPERSGDWREDDLAARNVHHQGAGTGAGSEALPSALRLLAVPERVDVDRDPEPRRVVWRGRALAIAHARGPERLAGDWWADGYHREYWRCESDDEVGELVLYRDSRGWWLQGWYD